MGVGENGGLVWLCFDSTDQDIDVTTVSLLLSLHISLIPGFTMITNEGHMDMIPVYLLCLCLCVYTTSLYWFSPCSSLCLFSELKPLMRIMIPLRWLSAKSY